MNASPHRLSPALQARLHTLSHSGLQQQVRLAPFTSFRIGGPAAYLAVFKTLSQLVAALEALHQAQTPFLLLGGGSNVLIADAGVSGLTIINQCKDVHWPEHSQLNEQDAILVEVDAGAPLAGFARASIQRGLAGLSWAVSIPGSVGGAVVGNAGAHGGDIASVLVSVRVWQAGRIRQWSAQELALAYRSSRLKGVQTMPGQHPIVLSATFRLTPDVDGRGAAAAAAAIQHRRRSQPVEKSAGSIFKNPPGDYAGRLIEAAGLKGHCVGDACISEKHANFIINQGAATAADVVALMTLARERVFQQFGILLTPEILFVGDWGEDLPFSDEPNADHTPQPASISTP